MHGSLKSILLVTVFVAIFSAGSRGQEEAGWRISPEKINLQAGTSRTLQILDDNAQELRGALWSVDQPDLGEIREENGHVAMYAKAAGTVHVSASLRGETRTREIRIWPADQPMPKGITAWGMHPIGREIGDLPAVPGAGSVVTFSLEQTARGNTYLRGVDDEGIQEWAWLMPEETREAELICGDWLGGALVGANRNDSFTLYVVGNDGKLRWDRAFAGKRKAHAYNLDHLLHIVTQSADGTFATVTGLDGVTGEQRFELPIPASHEQMNHVRRKGTGFVCAADNTNSPAMTTVSGLFVNIDGLAYVAFAHSDWTLTTGACAAGAAMSPRDVTLAGEQRLTLWQIHPDGTRRETVIEMTEARAQSSALVTSLSPTREIIPDGLGGVLLSVRQSPDAREATPHSSQEFIYRLDDEGKLLYKLLLPAYAGLLKDSMVLGENDRGFTTRGSLLIAFDVREGKELWRWDSGVRGIEVFAALADGGCLVQTPEALVNVHDATHAMEVVKGKAMMGWNGQLYIKHQ